VLLLRRYIIPLLCGGLALYPLYFAASATLDTLWGERRLYTWLLFDSRHALAHQFAADWAACAPIVAAFVLAGLLPLLVATRRRALPPLFGLTAATAVLAAALHFAALQIAVFAVTALLAALFTLLLAKVLGHARA
jgi:hypothetical protein